MPLDVNSLVSSMVGAASASLGNSWNNVKDYATTEFQQTAATLAKIEIDLQNGAITQDQARNLVDMQNLATQTVLLAIATMTLAAIQAAINAALGAIKSTVNAAVGFALL